MERLTLPVENLDSDKTDVYCTDRADSGRGHMNDEGAAMNIV